MIGEDIDALNLSKGTCLNCFNPATRSMSRHRDRESLHAFIMHWGVSTTFAIGLMNASLSWLANEAQLFDTNFLPRTTMGSIIYSRLADRVCLYF